MPWAARDSPCASAPDRENSWSAGSPTFRTECHHSEQVSSSSGLLSSSARRAPRPAHREAHASRGQARGVTPGDGREALVPGAAQRGEAAPEARGRDRRAEPERDRRRQVPRLRPRPVARHRRPEQMGGGTNPADIPWDDLPDAVVIKSARGAASRGVLPLRRVDGGWQIATRTPRRPEIRSRRISGSLVAAGSIAATVRRRGVPRRRKRDSSGRHQGLHVLRRNPGRRDAPCRRARSRRLCAVPHRRRPGHRISSTTYYGQPTDPTIPLPGALAELFEVAGRVSLAIRAPFSRVDLYDIRGRIVFGEVTPRPGSPGWFGRSWTSPWVRPGSGRRSGSGATSRTGCHPRRSGERPVRSRRVARAFRCTADCGSAR